MHSTSSIADPGFVPWLFQEMLRQISISTADWMQQIWDVFTGLLMEHWILVVTVVSVILIGLFLKAFITGRWGVLGSFLYRLFYLIFLLVIGGVFGADVFVSDYFDIIAIVGGAVCFDMVGMVLKKTGLRR